MESGNVRPIRQDGSPETDPFEQANAADQVDEIGNANQEEELELNLPEPLSAQEPEEAPEPINKKPAAKPKTAGAGKGLAYTAIGMSAVAIAMSGLSILTQKGSHAAVTEQIAAVESYVTDVRQQAEGMVKQVSDNTKAIASNTQQLKSFEDIRSEILVYSSALDQMKGEVASIHATAVEGKASIGEQRSLLEELSGRVGQLEARPARTVTKVVRTKPVPVAKRKADPAKLEGASLASIDAWGSQTNVMLRDGDGVWIPLSQGDFYKGWQLVSAKGNAATFKNGKRTRKLQIEG